MLFRLYYNGWKVKLIRISYKATRNLELAIKLSIRIVILTLVRIVRYKVTAKSISWINCFSSFNIGRKIFTEQYMQCFVFSTIRKLPGLKENIEISNLTNKKKSNSR